MWKIMRSYTYVKEILERENIKKKREREYLKG